MEKNIKKKEKKTFFYFAPFRILFYFNSFLKLFCDILEQLFLFFYENKYTVKLEKMVSYRNHDRLGDSRTFRNGRANVQKQK